MAATSPIWLAKVNRTGATLHVNTDMAQVAIQYACRRLAAAENMAGATLHVEVYRLLKLPFSTLATAQRGLELPP